MFADNFMNGGREHIDSIDMLIAGNARSLRFFLVANDTRFFELKIWKSKTGAKNKKTRTKHLSKKSDGRFISIPMTTELHYG